MRLFLLFKKEVVEKENQFPLTYLVFIDKRVCRQEFKFHLVKIKTLFNIRAAERRRT